MKRFFLAGLAFSALIMPAMAADMPLKALPPPPTWTGLYWGANVGWIGSSQYNITNTGTDTGNGGFGTALGLGAIPGTIPVSHSGFFGGGQIGYNWQLPSQWLIGLEADLQGSGIKGSASQTLSPALFDMTSTGVTKSIDWFGTVRGRVGFLVTPQWLLYGTGGLAYGETKSSFTTTDLSFGCVPNATLCANGASSGIRAGWTAGAGAEAMLAPNWSVKVEYLYVDLGGRSMNIPAFTLPAIAFSASTPFREQIARVGLNYHFDWAGPVVAKY